MYITETRKVTDLRVSCGGGGERLARLRANRETGVATAITIYGGVGEILALENLPQEGAQRVGHIPGASNVFWSRAVKEGGTIKSPEELKQFYPGKGIVPDKEIIAYSQIDEGSSHPWFVLKYLLGHSEVLHYDGSWTAYWSMVNVPI